MQDFEEELKKYRYWNKVSVLSFILTITTILLYFWLHDEIVFFEYFKFVIFGLILLFLFTVYKVRYFTCPKCKRFFSISYLLQGEVYQANSRDCPHCGLSAYKKN